jgi:hypothetical protein
MVQGGSGMAAKPKEEAAEPAAPKAPTYSAYITGDELEPGYIPYSDFEYEEPDD